MIQDGNSFHDTDIITNRIIESFSRIFERIGSLLCDILMFHRHPFHFLGLHKLYSLVSSLPLTITNEKKKIQTSLLIFVISRSAACLCDSVTCFLVSYFQPEMRESDELFILEMNKVVMAKKS